MAMLCIASNDMIYDNDLSRLDEIQQYFTCNKLIIYYNTCLILSKIILYFLSRFVELK